MGNRQQNQPGSQGRRDYRSSEDDESRFSSENDRNYDRDYGRYGNRDERENSVRSTRYDEGRGSYGQANDTRDESGSTGRTAGFAGYGDFGQGDYSQPGRGKNSGQERYGQTGYGQGWQEPYGEGQQYGSSGAEQGLHRGKGPKNYQRSDERLKEMVCERLRDDPQIDASEVTVNVQGGKITLEGSVDSRQTKHAIEEVADQLGIQDVQNNLRVIRAGQQSTSTSGGSTSAGKSATSSDDGETSKSKRN